MKQFQSYSMVLVILSTVFISSSELLSKEMSKRINHAEGMTIAEIEIFLRTAKVTLIEDTELGITKPKRITLYKDNITLRAVFKSYSTKIKLVKGLSKRTQFNNADRYQNDLAAYHLNIMLSLNMIPVTVIRKVEGKKGAVQLWVEDSLISKHIHESKSKALDVCAYKKQNEIMDLFDILIFNDDRNLGNVLYTINNCRLWMIDHSRSFRAKVGKPKTLKNVKIRMSKHLAEKLKQLNSKILKAKLGDYITAYQIGYVMKRRDLILKLWEENGKADFLPD